MPVRIGIDTGGTFTDLIGVDETTHRLIISKTPSTPRLIRIDRIFFAVIPGSLSHISSR